MVQAAHRFEKARCELESVLARWDGDQFALLLFDVPTSDAALGVGDADAGMSARAVRAAPASHLTSPRAWASRARTPGLQRAEDLLREADIALVRGEARRKARAPWRMHRRWAAMPRAS